ncbi:MAG TPA: hypothetical protein VML75_19970 [Kofleriaceae bacterium]|nr:hypothetical protein [Kofleriaceae bacterium]
MRWTRIPIAALLVATVLGIGPAAAQKRDVAWKGALAYDDTFAFGLWLSHVGIDGSGDDGMGELASTDSSGQFGVFRFSVGGTLRETRFGSVIGLDFTMGLGWFTSDVLHPAGGGTWGRLFLDVESNVLAEIYRHRMARLTLVGGGGLNTDMAYLVAGARVAGELPDKKMAWEVAFTDRPGVSYDEADAREQRLAATLILRGHRLGLGLELWHGHQRGEGGTPPPSRALRGDYDVLFVNVTGRR